MEATSNQDQAIKDIDMRDPNSCQQQAVEQHQQQAPPRVIDVRAVKDTVDAMEALMRVGPGLVEYCKALASHFLQAL